MSNKIMTMVWEHAHYQGTRKLVLLALADAANQEGLCWPSMTTIARMSECSVRRAREHVTALTAEDWVERQEHPGHSNWYLVHMPEKLQQALAILPPDEPSADTDPGEGSPPSVVEYVDPGERSPGYADDDVDPGEISPGGRRDFAGGVGEISPGGRRALAGRTPSNPKKNHKGTPQRVRAENPSPSKAGEEEEEEEPDGATLPPPPTPPALEPGYVWSRAVDYIRTHALGTQALASWIVPLRLLEATPTNGGIHARLVAPSSDQARLAEQRYHGLIAQAISQVFALPASRVQLVIDGPQVARVHTLAEVAP